MEKNTPITPLACKETFITPLIYWMPFCSACDSDIFKNLCDYKMALQSINNANGLVKYAAILLSLCIIIM